MKLSKLICTGVLALAVASAFGCGVRATIQPDPGSSSAPSAQGGPGTITVTVVDNAGKPIAGADVSLTDSTGTQVDDQTSGSDGTVSFSAVPVGTGYTVTADNGGTSGTQSGLGVDGAQPVVAQIMLVASNGAQATVGGTVTDALSGAPVPGATVSIVGTQATVHTDATGNYVIPNAPAGSSTVVATAPGFGESRTGVLLQASQLGRANLKLYPAGDPRRQGHTLVTTLSHVVEMDKFGNPTWTSHSGAFMARNMPNGNMLITGDAGVAELSSMYTTVWQYEPLLFGRLSHPQGISMASNGDVVIADTNNNRVLEVTPQLKVARTLKTRLNHPEYAEREDSKTTLVADTMNDRVIEVDDNGQIVWSAGDGTASIVNHPSFATRLPNGNTLITDSGNSRILEVSPQGGLVWMYGGKGDGSVCRFPNSAVRLPNGDTLIADTGNNRVIEVDSSSNVVWHANVEQPLFAERI
ncbi:MAG TPA: carboxypeptidase regulatory-like domain-containing protein [Oscillatoriaceae cyanobacterium]